MDARIGQLNNGTFYAYTNGYAVEPVMGTLEQVEVALGIRGSVPVEAPQKAVKVAYKSFDVRLTFQYPAWNEKEGLLYSNISAQSKKDAIKQARKMAEDDGHAVGGRGMYWFSATEQEQ